MVYSHAELVALRTELRTLKPTQNAADRRRYVALRLELVMSHLPAAHYSTLAGKRMLDAMLLDNERELSQQLMPELWLSLLPNERMALELLHYETGMLADKESILYAHLNSYIDSRLYSSRGTSQQFATYMLWEMRYQQLPPVDQIGMRQKAVRFRKTITTLFNTYRVHPLYWHTPDYVTQHIQADYDATPLEDLLPEIAFPLEEVARDISQTIVAENAKLQRQLRGEEPVDVALIENTKSIISESASHTEADDAFVELYTTIIDDGTRDLIEKIIQDEAAKGSTEEAITEAIEAALIRQQDVTLPHKIENLSLHRAGKATEIDYRERGDAFYRWRTQQDDKVRSSHSERDGQVFRWDQPPEDGHPGEAFGCRCAAEPVQLAFALFPAIGAASAAEQAAILIGAATVATAAMAVEKMRKDGVFDNDDDDTAPQPLAEDEATTPTGPEDPEDEEERDTDWTLGKHKSDERWKNQLDKRKWSEEDITRTIREGEEFTAPNKINPENTATRYQTSDGRFVVRDDVTNEIIQVSDDGFIPN